MSIEKFYQDWNQQLTCEVCSMRVASFLQSTSLGLRNFLEACSSPVLTSQTWYTIENTPLPSRFRLRRMLFSLGVGVSSPCLGVCVPVAGAVEITLWRPSAPKGSSSFLATSARNWSTLSKNRSGKLDLETTIWNSRSWRIWMTISRFHLALYRRRWSMWSGDASLRPSCRIWQ